ncbi:MAG TPA: hypothetical protein VGH89_23870, partial [Pseudonocardia sp.]
DGELLRHRQRSRRLTPTDTPTAAGVNQTVGCVRANNSCRMAATSDSDSECTATIDNPHIQSLSLAAIVPRRALRSDQNPTAENRWREFIERGPAPGQVPSDEVGARRWPVGRASGR